MPEIAKTVETCSVIDKDSEGNLYCHANGNLNKEPITTVGEAIRCRLFDNGLCKMTDTRCEPTEDGVRVMPTNQN